MRLFEAGILEKMTSSEYELMFSAQNANTPAEDAADTSEKSESKTK
jgi:hypothetical protein